MAAEGQLHGQDTPTCFDFQFGLLGDASIVDVLGDASNRIAAHLRFAAVGIEHSHACIGHRGGTDQHQPIAAYSLVTVAHRHGRGGNIRRNRLGKAIDVDIVIASSVHLGELHGTSRDPVWCAQVMGSHQTKFGTYASDIHLVLNF